MIRIGIISPSEIAFRRFLPSLSKIDGYIFKGVAIADAAEWSSGKEVPNFESIKEREFTKASSFIEGYGGKLFESYSSLIHSEEIDAIYVPLPPALHFRWAKESLSSGKHIFVEKPFTTSLEDAEMLVSLASRSSLALHENYMFAFHNQLQAINDIVTSGEIGEVRLYRISFGFPRRAQNDFRYSKCLGGGALFDCCGYTLKYASMLLGPSAHLTCSHLNYLSEFEVDMFGSATMVNDEGLTAQLAFGMDNNYKCELEIWGSTGTLKTNRVLTAPAGFTPTAEINKNGVLANIDLPSDDSFQKSLLHFQRCISDDEIRNENYHNVLRQQRLVNQFVECLK